MKRTFIVSDCEFVINCITIAIARTFNVRSKLINVMNYDKFTALFILLVYVKTHKKKLLQYFIGQAKNGLTEKAFSESVAFNSLGPHIQMVCDGRQKFRHVTSFSSEDIYNAFVIPFLAFVISFSYR